jgi:6-phosphofructokinase
MPDVVGVQTAGGPAPGYHAAVVAVLEGAAQPSVDGAGRPSGADHLTVAFEPHLAGGITGQVAALVIG